MTGIPRYREWHGPALLAAGFRPFFLGSAVWACVAVPLWLAIYGGSLRLPIMLQPAVWHAHEMVFGFAAATVAGFMLTAIPNWTGRMPLQGWSLLVLVLLWAGGRVGILISAIIGAPAATVLDLAFPVAFLAVVGREIVAGRNWRNLPMVAALASLLAANLLVHFQALGIADTAMAGNRWGIATLLMLISVVGGRIIPSFTRNWLVRQRPDRGVPAPFGRVDYTALAMTAIALVAWIIAPDSMVTSWLCLIAGIVQGVRLSRWRGLATLREPLLWILHLGYGWLAVGFLLIGANAYFLWLPATTAVHALTVGAIGTMTLAVMTRATRGHTGQALSADRGTTAIYVLVTLAAVGRLVAPVTGANYLTLLSLSGAAWSGAYGLFVLLYLRPLALPRRG